MAVAFFDLDKTLIYRNSSVLWLKRELSLGHISYLHAFKAFGLVAMYSMGMSDMEDSIRWAIRTIEGVAEKEIDGRIATFYADDIKDLYRPGGLEALEAHRGRGDKVVLLSSASIYLGRFVKDALDLDDILCSELEVDPSGRYTGEPKLPLCYGPGKRVLGERFVEQHGETLEDATFYTDSMSDMPMMEAVGHPVAVNPDPRLRRAANKRGWPIVDWGRP